MPERTQGVGSDGALRGLPRGGWISLAVRAGFLVFALWMISPMFTSSYVEAYVARLQSMAILNHVGQLGMDDQAYPINTELLYVTRVGMVWLLQMAMLALHSTGLWVLRVITIGSLGLVAGSSVVFARRWAGVPAWAVLACLVVTPGVIEPSFFIADNLVAAGLTCVALALVTEKVGWGRWVGIGAIAAAATLVRLDAVLIVPAIVAVAWLGTRSWRGVGVAVGFALVGAAAVFAVSQWVTGVSLRQSFEVGRFFSAVNDNPAIYQTGMRKTEGLIFFGFFGLIALPLVGIGAWENWKRWGRAWSVVMTALPVLFYAAVIPHANEIRDFCIMGVPFVLLHGGGAGVAWLVAAVRDPLRARRWGATALLGWFGVVLLAPPYISMRDGPRALTGRLYSPVFWRQWQGRTLGMVDQIHSLVDGVKPGETMQVISSQFEPERYLHLRLLQEGFRLDTAAAEPRCRSIERFERDGRTVVSVRTENPYGLIPGEENGHRLESAQIADSLGCLAGERFVERYFFSIGESGEAYWPGLAGEEVEIPRHFPLRILHRASYGFFRSVPLSEADAARLERAAEAGLASTRKVAGAPEFGDARFTKTVEHRFWWPPAR